jgi:hypothetical protein
MASLPLEKPENKSASNETIVSQMLFKTFLETVPPTRQLMVSAAVSAETLPKRVTRIRLETPQLSLHCKNEHCKGVRFFRYHEGDRSIDEPNTQTDHYVTYICSNCRTSLKTFSLRIQNKGTNNAAALAYKFGEIPVFGPETPPRLLELLDDQREIFLKGRRCENQGLGIGAFGYYRRVVEHQKNRSTY